MFARENFSLTQKTQNSQKRTGFACLPCGMCVSAHCGATGQHKVAPTPCGVTKKADATLARCIRNMFVRTNGCGGHNRGVGLFYVINAHTQNEDAEVGFVVRTIIANLIGNINVALLITKFLRNIEGDGRFRRRAIIIDIVCAIL